MHILEAGFEAPQRPCVLLLHGFPELAFSWRKVMVPLAAAGYHVVAPDQRGYGRTTGWDSGFDADLAAFSFPNLVRDLCALVDALGGSSLLSVVGHDFGSPMAAWCALMRPDIFRSLVMMSAPFAGAPVAAGINRGGRELDQALARLEPPRKHYHGYFSSPTANDELLDAAQGLGEFLRGYFHTKSADWPGNRPAPLTSANASEFEKLPGYYVMPRADTMPQTVAALVSTAGPGPDCDWLTDAELEVFVSEYRRTGFQGGLNWYRCATGQVGHTELAGFADRTIDVPALFIGGRSDWGVYQTPGSLERMGKVCPRLEEVCIFDDAGHWVQQEKPQRVVERLIAFLGGLPRDRNSSQQ